MNPIHLLGQCLAEQWLQEQKAQVHWEVGLSGFLRA